LNRFNRLKARPQDDAPQHGSRNAKEKGGATFRRRAAFNPSSPALWRDGGIAATIASDRARAPQARV